MSVDPTRVDLAVDPLERRMRGVAIHGNTPFDVPYISQIEGNLWTGGCASGLVLPDFFEHVVSLYPWESYSVENFLLTYAEFAAYDSADGPPDRIDMIVSLVADCVEDGPTLVHCQAGLNRSALVASLVLVRLGRTPIEAVQLVRERRSPACLCNETFLSYVLGMQEEAQAA